MQAITYLAPALAPLAIKLIDKYVFNDDRPPVPQIISLPASPHCAYCGYSDDGYVNNRTCSTCASESSTYRPSSHRLSTKSTVRSSSTSDAYDNEKSQSCSHRSRRRSSGSSVGSVKQLEQQYIPGKTLDILAGNLKREIMKEGKVIPSQLGENSSRYKIQYARTDTASSSGSRKSRSRKSNVHEAKESHCDNRIASQLVRKY